MRSLLAYYRKAMVVSIQEGLQYRAGTYFYLIGFLIEPVVYLSVWKAVAEAQGGSIGTFTTNDLTSYYIVWTLVRAMNVAFTPYAWEWRIRGGRLNEMLSKPIHPFHRDFTFFSGMKIPWIIYWLPIAGILVLTFRPQLHPTWFEGIAFFVAIWAGFAVRFCILWLLGLVTFWTTRASAIFEIVVAGELLLSGRLVPIQLMPEWVQQLSRWLPFQSTFQFPIDVLIGRLEPAGIWFGLAEQFLWIAILGGAIALVWKTAIKRYTAVGG